MSFQSLEIQNLQRLAILLENKDRVNLDELSELTKESTWRRWTSKWLFKSEARIERVVHLANAYFNQLEAEGVEMLAARFDSDLEKAQAQVHLAAYASRITPYLTVFKRIDDWMTKSRPCSAGLKKELQELRQRYVGLRYRLGKTIQDPEIGLKKLDQHDEASYAYLKEQAIEWKKTQELADDKQLNWVEENQLKQAAKYPEWVELMKNQKKTAAEFFNWSLRDYCSVSLFIKQVGARRYLKDALLPNIIGRSRRPDKQDPTGTRTYVKLASSLNGVVRRVPFLTLYQGTYKRFDSSLQTPVNVADPSQFVHFQTGNYQLSLKELGKESAQKRNREANVTLTAYGIVNDNSVKGVWNADKQAYETEELNAKITRSDWLASVPPVEIVSDALMRQWFGDRLDCWSEDAQDKRKMFFEFATTRQSPDLNCLKCHAFLRIHSRQDDGNWEVKEIGLYADEFQQSLWDGIKKFGATLWRVFCRLDQNGSYTHRQQAYWPFFPSKEKCQELLNALHDEMIQGPGVFQFAGEDNCTGGFQRLLEKVFGSFGAKQADNPDSIETIGVPNFCRMRVTDGMIGCKPFDNFLAFIGRRNKKIQQIAIPLLTFILWGFRKKTYKTLKGEIVVKSMLGYYQASYKAYQEYFLYVPSHLHVEIEKARKTQEGPFQRGRIFWGNTEKYVYKSNVA